MSGKGNIPRRPNLVSCPSVGRGAGASRPQAGAWLGRLHTALAGLGLTCLIAAVACAFSYHRDLGVLRRTGVQIAGDSVRGEETVLAMLHWVHEELGTRRNDGYFVLACMRATPLQVLESGGDCADKSRLLSAMLRAVGIPATMAMCFDPGTGRPSHTVVEARVAPGRFMVVDPAFDLAFPEPGGAGYYDLLELRRRPSLLFQRLEQLRNRLPRNHPVHAYNATRAVYERAATINWGRNAFLKLLGGRLSAWMGPEVHRLPRPVVLEEPKLAVAALALGFAVACVAGAGLMRLFVRRRRRSQAGTGQVPDGPTAIAGAGA